ncbi:hypothetical protein [Streptomyces sp. 11x1]|uniref:hypothetical protein n=1 Tax=Streptomyces sp. 11x1 TaxID=3038642 RepID=UPI00292DA331|nr:hypothetical protein [Streptomyces sp. 11x1]WNZ10075.1 hypothetical protein P8T65_22390 [Streptomyces sp. 11x1]
MHTLVAVAALTTLPAGASTTSYAASRGEAAHGVGTAAAEAEAAATAAARKAPTPRILQPGEHLVVAPGFEFWITEEDELPGMPGWGVWYAISDLPTVDAGREFLRGVTVLDTKGGVYSQLHLR